MDGNLELAECHFTHDNLLVARRPGVLISRCRPDVQRYAKVRKAKVPLAADCAEILPCSRRVVECLLLHALDDLPHLAVAHLVSSEFHKRIPPADVDLRKVRATIERDDIEEAQLDLPPAKHDAPPDES
jgi:hypothetical protein